MTVVRMGLQGIADSVPTQKGLRLTIELPSWHSQGQRPSLTCQHRGATGLKEVSMHADHD